MLTNNKQKTKNKNKNKIKKLPMKYPLIGLSIHKSKQISKMFALILASVEPW